MPISAADRSTEERILRASPRPSDLTYRQLLRDINIMV
jgi:hypothetical protein